MGEYLKVNGREIKLGTCESLYYVRLEDLQKIRATSIDEQVPGNDSIDGYLNPSNGYRYRFPFPEEDGIRAGEYESYDKGKTVVINSQDAPKLYGYLRGKEWEHNTICHSVGVEGGGYNVNIIMPCPLSHDFPRNEPSVKLSCGGASYVVEIIQQKQWEGKIWTVIRCGYCKAAIRLELEGALELVHTLNLYADSCRKDEKSKADYYREIAARVMLGYL
jgi:hypothetical protein